MQSNNKCLGPSGSDNKNFQGSGLAANKSEAADKSFLIDLMSRVSRLIAEKKPKDLYLSFGVNGHGLLQLSLASVNGQVDVNILETDDETEASDIEKDMELAVAVFADEDFVEGDLQMFVGGKS